MSLHEAARSGDVDAMTRLTGGARLPAKVNARDKHSRTPLHLAAWANHPDAIKFLCSHGADVNATAVDDMSALHFAAQKCHVEACKALISCGAKANAKTRKGLIPLHLVALASVPREKDKASEEARDREQSGGEQHLTEAQEAGGGAETDPESQAVGVVSRAPATEHERRCCEIVRALVRKFPGSLQVTTKKGDTAQDMAKSSAVKGLLQQLALDPQPQPQPQPEKHSKEGGEREGGGETDAPPMETSDGAAEGKGGHGEGGKEVEEEGIAGGDREEDEGAPKVATQKVALTFDEEETGDQDDDTEEGWEGEGGAKVARFRKRPQPGSRSERPSRRSKVT